MTMVVGCDAPNEIILWENCYTLWLCLGCPKACQGGTVTPMERRMLQPKKKLKFVDSAIGYLHVIADDATFRKRTVINTRPSFASVRQSRKPFMISHHKWGKKQLPWRQLPSTPMSTWESPSADLRLIKRFLIKTSLRHTLLIYHVDRHVDSCGRVK